MRRFTTPHRRTVVKWLHWLILPLFIWFMVIQPHDIRPFGKTAFLFHSVLGLIFVALTLVWTGLYLRRGLLGRPGPKLHGVPRRLHRPLHHILIWGLFGVALGGFLLGLTSHVLLWAGGIVPIAPPLDLPRANRLVGQIHSAEFYILAGIATFHAGFHIWRHLWLRDNALRIMAPRLLHRFL